MRLATSTRRRAAVIAGVAVAGLILAGCTAAPGPEPTDEAGLTTVVIGETAPFQVANYLTLIAENLGYFDEEGIDAQFIGVSSNPLAPLVSGDVDIMTIAANGLSGLEQGIELRFIYASPANSPFSILVADDTDAAGEAHDFQAVMDSLVGVGIGTTVPGAFTDNITRYLVTLSGHTLDEIPVTPAGDATALVAGLTNGTFKAGFVASPLFESLMAQGGFTQALNLWEGDIPDFTIPSATPATTAEYADANPEIIAGFQRAVQRALDWVNDPANKDEFQSMVANRLSVDRSTLDATLETYFAAVGDSIGYTEAQWDTAIAVFKSNGVISQDYAYDEYVIPFTPDAEEEETPAP